MLLAEEHAAELGVLEAQHGAVRREAGAARDTVAQLSCAVERLGAQHAAELGAFEAQLWKRFFDAAPERFHDSWRIVVHHKASFTKGREHGEFLLNLGPWATRMKEEGKLIVVPRERLVTTKYCDASLVSAVLVALEVALEHNARWGGRIEELVLVSGDSIPIRSFECVVSIDSSSACPLSPSPSPPPRATYRVGSALRHAYCSFLLHAHSPRPNPNPNHTQVRAPCADERGVPVPRYGIGKSIRVGREPHYELR